MRTRLYLFFILFAFILGGCGPAATGTVEPSPPPALLPSDTPAGQRPTPHLPSLLNPGVATQIPTIPIPSNADLQVLIEKAKADLAGRLSIQADQISLLQAVEVTWPDASLGCENPGMAAAQVLTPGYLILLGANQVQYEYHSNKGTYFTYCMNPVPPLSTQPEK
jgi:hypothetical protein